MSVDSGITWRNITKDATGAFYWSSGRANLDTSTHGWQYFQVTFFGLHDSLFADTTLFRFTFLSKKNDSLKDGWIIDDLSVEYYVEGAVYQTQAGGQLQIYPNPANDQLNIVSPDVIKSISICNIAGQVIYAHEYNAQNAQITTSAFPPGMYFLKVNDTYIKKFVKQ